MIQYLFLFHILSIDFHCLNTQTMCINKNFSSVTKQVYESVLLDTGDSFCASNVSLTFPPPKKNLEQKALNCPIG